MIFTQSLLSGEASSVSNSLRPLQADEKVFTFDMNLEKINFSQYLKLEFLNIPKEGCSLIDLLRGEHKKAMRNVAVHEALPLQQESEGFKCNCDNRFSFCCE